jgi:hypothetical protein
MNDVIATRVIERTGADLMQAVFRECTGRIWTNTFRDPFLWVSEDGEVVSLYKKKARKLKPTMSGAYHAVSIGSEGNRTMHVHRLMAETWFGPSPFAGAVVRHLDGDRFNNRLSNLAWGTYAENAADQIAHGTSPTGERNGMARLTREAVRQMRELRAAGRTFKSIASQFGVSPMTAHRAITGGSWK